MKTILLCFCLSFMACVSSNKTTTIPSYTFPQDWLGSYEGELEMWNAEHGKLQTCPMKVQITATDTLGCYHWHSQIKFNGKNIVKNYNLIHHDSMPLHHYLMDENNGIYLDRILLDDSFYDYFEVNGLGLYGITRRVSGGILFEIASFKRSSASSSKYEGQDFKVDSVVSYKVLNTQKVLLQAIK